MSNTVLKGESAVIGVRFRAGIIHPEAPEWTLYDWDDKPLQTGTAVQSGDKWNAEITVPSNLPVPDGVQSVQLEFVVTDTAGKDHTISQEITIVDVYEEHRPYGLLWWNQYTSLEDTVIFDRQPTSIVVSLIEGSTTGNVVTTLKTATIDDPVAVASTERGLVFNIALTGLTFTNAASGSYYPYQLMIQANYASGNPDILIKPVYGMSPLIASKVNTLKRYLDKGQFTDILPSLQWSDEEMVHYLMEGVQYVNSSPPSATYWTIESVPKPLDSLVSMAAAWIALNARYIAEGMNKFNFTSGTVNLDWDRTPVLETKMNELKSALDNTLKESKRAVISVEGTGGGPAKAIGSLGISISPVTNYSVFGRYGAFRRG